MQKPQVKHYFFVIHTTYMQVQAALCCGDSVLARSFIDKTVATKQLLVALQAMLHEHNLVLGDILFIAATRGPGPFTTVRTALTFVNGVAFATNIPLVGINAFDAMVAEFAPTNETPYAFLLNAFGNDVYYRIHVPGMPVQEGAKNITALLQEMQGLAVQQPWYIAGNAVPLHRSAIESALRGNVLVDEVPQTASLEAVITLAKTQWQQQQGVTQQLLPLYLKEQSFAKKIMG